MAAPRISQMTSVNQQDIPLRTHLKSLSSNNSDYWSFRGKAVREHCHGYFQYPAMMVPQMQQNLIEAVRKYQPDIKWVSDPFVGSGTVLSETLMQGLNFSGQDINPLAILSCRAKSGPFRWKELTEKYLELKTTIQADSRKKIEAEFPGLEKWFNSHVSTELSKIRRTIRKEKALWARRFFWIALAETVRLSSNSRTATFKLHIRRKEELTGRNVSPISLVYTNPGEKY